MALLAHGGLGNAPSPISVMGDLYHPARPQKNPASTLLLRFEKRTALGYLPAETRLERSVPRSLLEACAGVTDLEALGNYWGNLESHVTDHLTAAEQPHLSACARAIRAEMRSRGVDPDSMSGFFPEAVTDLGSYAALARAVLYLAVLPDSPLRFRLYCATNSPYVPFDALCLNIDVTERFLQQHGETGGREVILGLQLANGETVRLSGASVTLPVLNKRVFFGTLHAPSTPLSSRLRTPGRSATLYLQ